MAKTKANYSAKAIKPLLDYLADALDARRDKNTYAIGISRRLAVSILGMRAMADILLTRLTFAITNGFFLLHDVLARGGGEKRVCELREILTRFRSDWQQWDSLDREQRRTLTNGASAIGAEAWMMLFKISEEEKRLRHISEAQKDFGRQLNQATLRKNLPIIERRREIIAARYKPDELSDREKCADAINLELDEVFKQVGMKPASSRTIRRDIQAILEGHSDRMRKK